MVFHFNFMKIKDIITFFLFFVLLWLAGCEKPIHRMDIDPVQKRLVLNGSLGPDLPFKIHVSSSMAPIGPEIVDVVTDAEIIITGDNNTEVQAKHDSMGFYLADWYPEANRKYRITVKAPTFEDAFVTVAVPNPLVSTLLSKDSADITYPYLLSFYDPPEEENTYMIRAWYQYKEIRHLWYGPGNWVDDTLIEKRSPVIHSVDELIGYYADGISMGDEAPSDGEKASTGFLISDELFDGREHVMRFKVSYVSRLDQDRPYLFVEVISVGRDFYNFVRSYSLYYDALQAPFAEPVAILSNIENGLGFVYGYSIHTDSIRLK
jgi:hypothetical protein